jgi:predicted AlkP superfamily phosphohydrolase/phosphomutase
MLGRRAFCAALGGTLALAGCKRKEQPMGKGGTEARRVIVLGMDGVDPGLLTRFRGQGLTPNFDALARAGGFAPLATTNPAESPVAWATLATGVNPGAHGVFDFLHRDPADYRLFLSITRPKGRSLTGTPVFESPLRATPFWECAAEAGIPTQVLRWPLTFPAAGKATVLAGLGVPDIQGGLGRYALYTTDAALARRDRRGETLLLAGDGGVFATEIRGPRTTANDFVTLPLALKSGVGKAALTYPGGALTLDEGAWSPRVSFTFPVGLFKKVKATAQFFLVRGNAPLILYLSPLAIDPADPVFPISAPAEYAPKLVKALGSFHTLGMHEDINALKDGVLSPAAFLASCDEAMRENEKLLAHALSGQDRGLLCAVFFTPDRIQHFFWAGLDREHPFNTASVGDGGPFDHTQEFRALGATPIAECYARLDRIVGATREALGPNDLLLIVSDHGFTTHRRDFHVNRFLVQEGYMALGEEVGREAFASVRWDSTAAYACGFAGVYLNLEGREGRGRVKRGEAAVVAGDIGKKLEALLDPATGLRPVRKAYLRDELFKGPHAQESPDIVLALEPGYECSSETALGGCPRELFADNGRPWSGTHLCDPSAVPGILCSNRRITAAAPHSLDLAPTVLAALGLRAPEEHEGRSFL